MLIYFISLPLILKSNFKLAGYNTPEGYVGVFTVLFIYFGLPATISYVKRKGLIFKEQNVNYEFTAPFTPKQILFKAYIFSFFSSVVLELAMLIGGILVFKLPIWKALLIFILQTTFSSISDYSMIVLIYGSEDLSERFKQYIKYAVYSILAVSAIYLIFRIVTLEGPIGTKIFEALNSDALLFVPVYGFELGVVSLIVKGYSLPRLISTILNVITSFLFIYFAKKAKSTGEFYEDAIKFATEYKDALEKTKKTGKSHRVGKEKKYLRGKSSEIKGSKAKSIFYKNLSEYRKLTKKDKLKTPLIILTLSTITGIFVSRYKDFNLDFEGFSLAVGAVSIYFNVITYKFIVTSEDFEHYSFYLIPDSMQKKVFYSGLLSNLRSILNAICLILPFGIITGFGIVRIIGSIFCYISVYLLFEFIDKGIGRVLQSRLGNSAGTIIAILITLILCGIGIGLGAIVEFTSGVRDIGFLITFIILMIINFLVLLLNGKLYKNMEFITEE